GDSYANYELHWTSASTSMVILMAGHSAQSCVSPQPPCYGYGPGCGSGSINGGPYHFKLFDFDGHTTGNQDNQLQASALTPVISCADVTISGADNVCPGTTNTYTETLNTSVSSCSNAIHHWTINGDGTISGSVTGTSVSVQAGSICGQF